MYMQVSQTFLGRMEDQRYGDQGAPGRGRRLQVSPGKSWAAPSTTAAGPSDTDEEGKDTAFGSSMTVVQ